MKPEKLIANLTKYLQGKDVQNKEVIEKRLKKAEEKLAGELEALLKELKQRKESKK